MPAVLMWAVATGLLVGTANHLRPALDKHQRRVKEQSAMDSETTRLEVRRRQALTNKVPEQHAALFKRFVRDSTRVEHWLDDEVKAEAHQRGLELSWEQISSVPVVVGASNPVPVFRFRVQLLPQPGASNPAPGFQGLLQVLHRLADGDPRCQWQQLSADLGPDQRLRASAELSVIIEPPSP